MPALLIGLGCLSLGATPLYGKEGDKLPPSKQIERYDTAQEPIWSVIMVDRRTGHMWAIETDQTLVDCWRAKPRDTGANVFTCEKGE
jgi:hypothetical protein